jgi:hypothetical protein
MRTVEKAPRTRRARKGATAMVITGVVFLLGAMGCAPEAANAPTVRPTPVSTKPSRDFTDGSIPCASTTRACGGFFPSIAPNPSVVTEWVIIGPYDLGAFAKTWSPTGETVQMSLSGGGTVTRGSGSNARTESFSLSCNQLGKQCGDGWRSYHTCDVERNSISGTTTHYAAFSPLPWTGTFSDSRVCSGPTSSTDCDSGTTNTQITDLQYDPYSDPSTDPSSGGSCDTGNATSGSGIQYEPGDYTNGETVDWTTGVGDGGSSVCGDAAIVEFVCIDVWDDATSSWNEWGCGYATTC